MNRRHDFSVNNDGKHKNGVLSVSLTLILAGLAFLFVNIGIIPTAYKTVLTAWPIWLLLIGVFSLFHRNLGTSITFLSVGAFFILPYLGAVNPRWGLPANFTQLYWPVLLIVAGLMMFFHRYFKYGKVFAFGCNVTPVSKWENEEGYFTSETTFESRKNIVLDPVFKGGSVKCSFGEVVLDLRKTTLKEGSTKLEVDLSFGSVVIIVPDSWNVQIKGNAAFGSFSDHRLNKSYYPDEPRMLTIVGKVAFGECELRD